MKLAIAIVLVQFGSVGIAPAQFEDRSPIHGAAEAPVDAAPRADAIRFARLVNTYEARAKMEVGNFRPLSDFASIVTNAPNNFRVWLVTNSTSYMFRLKDQRDACHFSVFSDDEGAIFTAAPIR